MSRMDSKAIYERAEELRLEAITVAEAQDLSGTLEAAAYALAYACHQAACRESHGLDFRARLEMLQNYVHDVTVERALEFLDDADKSAALTSRAARPAPPDLPPVPAGGAGATTEPRASRMQTPRDPGKPTRWGAGG